MAKLLKNFKSTIKYITNKSHLFNPFLAPILVWKFMVKNLLKLLCEGVCTFQFGKIVNSCKILSQTHFLFFHNSSKLSIPREFRVLCDVFVSFPFLHCLVHKTF